MKEMSKFNFNNYKRGTIIIEIQSLIPEKFINLLWKNNVHIKNITKVTITTMIMEIRLSDYNVIEAIAKKTGTKIKVLKRKGLSFFIIRMKRNVTLIGGIILFAVSLYYLSTFIWGIDIETDKYLSPYEIRRVLASYGVKSGVSKRKIDVYNLEEQLKKIDDVMWPRVRIEGSRLKVSIVESVTPPALTLPSESEPCDIIAKLDGEIVRIFTTAGTAVVKPGDLVKNNQLLVKGEQGKVGSTYSVHAKGEVVAKTYYEEVMEIPLRGVKTERTGRTGENIFINILGKKIYMKKTLNKFQQYDIIEDNKSFIKKELFYENINKEFQEDKEKVKNDAVELMTKGTMDKFNKTVKLIDKKVETEEIGNNLKVRVIFVIEQDIALPQKVQ
jgi:similar to stage IV sporulation protein